MSRRIVVRTAVQVAVLGLVAALTVALAGNPASGAFTAVTGSGGNSVGTSADFCVAGVQDVPVSNDSWTDQAAPTVSNGTSSALQVRSGSAANRRTYLRFSLTTRKHCTLQSAQLRLYNRVPTAGRVIDVHRADPAQSPQWDAGSITWNNQPAPTGTGAGSTAPAAPQIQTWDVTAHTTVLLTGPNNGFVLRDRVENDGGSSAQAYDEQSTAGGTVPTLRLTWG